MKLNPPEIAPKDWFILVAFKTGAYNLYPSIWSDYAREWKIFSPEPFIEAINTEEEDLIGWLPMPEIDSEGNVFFAQESEREK